MTITLDTYKLRLEAAERAGPGDDSTPAKILAGELRAAHKDAMRGRDAAAAVLHRDHGWAVTRLCIAIHGRPNKVAVVRTAIEAALETKPATMPLEDAVAAFESAQGRVETLWGFYRRAKEAERATGGLPETTAETDSPLQLPDDPRERAQAAAEQIREVKVEYQACLLARNRGAAALIVHKGWAKRQAAQLAGAYVGRLDIYDDTTVDEADPDKVAALAQRTRVLDARKRALTAARDSAIRALAGEVGPAQLARELGLTDERIVQIRDVQNA